MNPEEPQFDELGARRTRKEHDAGEHEVFGPQAKFGTVPAWLKEKRAQCPACREEDGPDGSLSRL